MTDAATTSMRVAAAVIDAGFNVLVDFFDQADDVLLVEFVEFYLRAGQDDY